MARFRRRGTGRTRGRPAGPFATSVKNGRARSWESLSNSYNFLAWNVVFPNNALVVAGNLVNYRVLTPINVTRGVVTVQRIRGTLAMLWRTAEINGAGGPNVISAPVNIQLVPARNGAIVDSAVLDPKNSADVESNRILWRKNMMFDTGSGDVGFAVDGGRFLMGVEEVDVKVSRRYDVSEWALIAAINYDAVSIALNLGMLELRALYLATDGL